MTICAHIRKVNGELLDFEMVGASFTIGDAKARIEKEDGASYQKLTNRVFRGSRHGGSSTEFAERAAKRGTPRNAHGTGMLSASRKAGEGRGRSRKVAGG